MGLALLSACGGEGSETSCDLNSCEITFDRGVEANANVLGVEVTLVGIENDMVTLEVAGQRVSIPMDGSTEVGGFQVTIQEVTQDNVVVQISSGGGE